MTKTIRIKKRKGNNIYLYYPVARSVIKYHRVSREAFYCSPACTSKVCERPFVSCFGCPYKVD